MIALAFAAVMLASPPVWTQFRLNAGNNAVVNGTMQATWKLKTKGPFSSSPVIAGGTLYIGNNAGELFAIDPASGKIKWTSALKNPIMAAPIVYGNVVIAGEGNEISPDAATPSHPIHVGSPPNALVAYDRTTGTIVWQKSLPGSGMPTAAIINGLLVHHDGAGYVYGIDPLSGATRYAVNLHAIASMAAALPLANGTFATNGIAPDAVFVLRASDGATVWQYGISPLASGLGDCPLASDGRALFCNYITAPSSAVPVQTERGSIFRAFAVDVRTGKRRWDVTLETGTLPKRNEAAIPLFTRGTLYMGCSLAPYVHAIDPVNGAVRWRFRAHGPVKGGIAEAGGVLYFGDFAGYIWAVNAASGARIGDVRFHGVPFNVGSPLIAGGTLIIGSAKGTLYAIPLKHIRSSHDQ